MYYPFIDEHGCDIPNTSFEVWEVTPDDERTKTITLTTQPMIDNFGDTLPAIEPGWYWWACFPGCLPDGDKSGPFKNFNDAILDAWE